MWSLRLRRVQARSVEAKIVALPSYSLICMQQEDQSCHAPFGLPSMVYAVPKNDPLADVDTDNVDGVEDTVAQADGDSLYRLADECASLPRSLSASRPVHAREHAGSSERQMCADDT